MTKEFSKHQQINDFLVVFRIFVIFYYIKFSTNKVQAYTKSTLFKFLYMYFSVFNFHWKLPYNSICSRAPRAYWKFSIRYFPYPIHSYAQWNFRNSLKSLTTVRFITAGACHVVMYFHIFFFSFFCICQCVC